MGAGGWRQRRLVRDTPARQLATFRRRSLALLLVPLRLEADFLRRNPRRPGRVVDEGQEGAAPVALPVAENTSLERAGEARLGLASLPFHQLAQADVKVCLALAEAGVAGFLQQL